VKICGGGGGGSEIYARALLYAGTVKAVLWYSTAN